MEGGVRPCMVSFEVGCLLPWDLSTNSLIICETLWQAQLCILLLTSEYILCLDVRFKYIKTLVLLLGRMLPGTLCCIRYNNTYNNYEACQQGALCVKTLLNAINSHVFFLTDTIPEMHVLSMPNNGRLWTKRICNPGK